MKGKNLSANFFTQRYHNGPNWIAIATRGADRFRIALLPITPPKLSPDSALDKKEKYKSIMRVYIKRDFVFLKLDVRILLVLVRNITLNTI